MQQNHWRPRPSTQVAQARAIHVHPALFPDRSDRWNQTRPRGHAENFVDCFVQAKIFLVEDNSFPTAGVYLTEHRLCSFTLGSFGSPFLPWVGATLSGLR